MCSHPGNIPDRSSSSNDRVSAGQNRCISVSPTLHLTGQDRIRLSSTGARGTPRSDRKKEGLYMRDGATEMVLFHPIDDHGQDIIRSDVVTTDPGLGWEAKSAMRLFPCSLCLGAQRSHSLNHFLELEQNQGVSFNAQLGQ